MDTDVMRLEQFAWLLDNNHQPRNPKRLQVLWQWASEMADFQRQANRTQQAVDYCQRGQVLRILRPVKEGV